MWMKKAVSGKVDYLLVCRPSLNAWQYEQLSALYSAQVQWSASWIWLYAYDHKYFIYLSLSLSLSVPLKSAQGHPLIYEQFFLSSKIQEMNK